MSQCSKLAGAAADLRENKKNDKYKELAQNYWFIPVGLETLGAWGTNGHKLVKEIVKKVEEETGEKRATAYLFQQISIAVQRGNSSCVLGTVPHSRGWEEVFEFVSAS